MYGFIAAMLTLPIVASQECVRKADHISLGVREVQRSVKTSDISDLEVPVGLREVQRSATEFVLALGTTAHVSGSGVAAGITEYDCLGDTMYDVYAGLLDVEADDCLTIADACSSRQTYLSSGVSKGSRRISEGTARVDSEGACSEHRDISVQLGSRDLDGPVRYCVRDGVPFRIIADRKRVTDFKDGIIKTVETCEEMGEDYSYRGHIAVPDAITSLTFTCPASRKAELSPSIRTKAQSHIVFKIHCDRIVTVPLDPIVNPGTLSGHSHDIVGSVNFSGLVTAEDLRDGLTTCDRPQDHSMYWYPSMYLRGDDGLLHLVYSRMVMYYFTQYMFNLPDSSLPTKRAKMHAFPLGLRMVVGNAKNVNGVTNGGIRWRCHVMPTGETTQRLSGRTFDSIPGMVEPGTGHKCTQWQADIPFPSCWNGVDLDSPDHISHMAYIIGEGDNRRCPESHPVPVPEMFMETVYHPRDADMRGRFKADADVGDYYLATGDNVGGSIHADVITGWDVQEMVEFLDTCNDGKGCSLQHQPAKYRQLTTDVPDVPVDNVVAFPPS